jgi:hypothetical protein
MQKGKPIRIKLLRRNASLKGVLERHLREAGFITTYTIFESPVLESLILGADIIVVLGGRSFCLNDAQKVVHPNLRYKTIVLVPLLPLPWAQFDCDGYENQSPTQLEQLFLSAGDMGELPFYGIKVMYTDNGKGLEELAEYAVERITAFWNEHHTVDNDD